MSVAVGIDALPACAERCAAGDVALPDLVVRNIWKSFDSTPPVLKGIDLCIPSGQSVALIGANGAGKSTLLRCSMMLLCPDQGEVRLFGKRIDDLANAQLNAIRNQVGFVFQKHNLVPRLSAFSNVLHGAIPRGGLVRPWLQSLASAGFREEGMACLDRVGLAALAMRRADRLSGGQSQRVAIARALMQRPRMMVADEPVASLDPGSGEEVMSLFLRLVREQGLTLLFTSHDLEQALRFADRVVALQNGEIVLDANTSTLDVSALRRLYD
jgi:phosphonate transport system ATP-binding protein